MFKAVLWDVDGTLAETERDGHRVAFNEAFEALDVPWRWSEGHYGALLGVAGGRERLLHDMQARSLAPAEAHERQELAARIHKTKNEIYARIVAGGRLRLREGVSELMEDCDRAGIRMGIVTTTSRCNVEALLRTHLGKDWESKFATVVCAEDAPTKKPHPQAYLLALEALQLHCRETVAIEDAPAGIAAAQAAGIPVIVTRSHYFSAEPVRGALAVGPSLGRCGGWQPTAYPGLPRIGLGQLTRWYAQSSSA
ncbi:MAG: HAD-IA family hydrolase [Pseudomonadota bacterium]|nr:HAD-IA family hydrolase [Pseudomonadota bacterium]